MARSTGRQLSLPLANRRAAEKSEAVDHRAISAISVRAELPRESLRGRLLERAAQLAYQLSHLLDEQVKLTLTDNTSTMVSFRRTRGLVSFRVHRMFAEAPPQVVRALADYATRGKRSAGSMIDEFVRANEHRVRKVRAERTLRSLDPRGRVHDLQAIFDDLNARFFRGTIDARIGWGREAPARRRRSIKMGTYFHDSRIIKLHPALDRPEVPLFFVRFVVFHEMLHQAVPPENVGGRRISHSAEFRRRERAYPDYAKSIAWERENLSLLLGGVRTPYRFDPDDPLA